MNSFMLFSTSYSDTISFQIALTAIGSIDGLLEYSRIRNNMSSMIY